MLWTRKEYQEVMGNIIEQFPDGEGVRILMRMDRAARAIENARRRELYRLHKTAANKGVTA